MCKPTKSLLEDMHRKTLLSYRYSPKIIQQKYMKGQIKEINMVLSTSSPPSPELFVYKYLCRLLDASPIVGYLRLWLMKFGEQCANFPRAIFLGKLALSQHWDTSHGILFTIFHSSAHTASRYGRPNTGERRS